MDEVTVSLVVLALIILFVAISSLTAYLANREYKVFLGIFLLSAAFSFFSFDVATFHVDSIKKIDATEKKVNDKLKKIEKTRKSALEKVEKEGYKVFIDGKEVDPDTIDFSLYKIKINTEKKAVYCTKE